ncbi:hypothetical protein G436_3373 [Leptospira interrogans serovar Hardjo str. Norma]|uniref:Uncharacterized protein n=2 Tax=Leptospira interrogans TaxID=173 RepID=A0A0M4MWG4_LEPIR|nr:hypothetical protein G436_3373 [Leptospira interrogans serovar Hardjo str. Norma]OQM32225.1 hypothetical protein DV30_05780 [Leptospira interrogans serovar Canicola str. Gui44]
MDMSVFKGGEQVYRFLSLFFMFGFFRSAYFVSKDHFVSNIKIQVCLSSSPIINLAGIFTRKKNERWAIN